MTTSEKKPKSKSNDRQRTARNRATWESPAIEPIVKQQPEAPAWREQAAFHVTLDQMSDVAGTMSWRTHAYHEETGDERVLPGVLDQEVIGWMRERAGLLPTVPAEPPTEAPHPAIGLSVGALELIELPAARQAGGEQIGARLCAQVTFDLIGATAYLATTDLRPYGIQVLALDIQGAKSVLLASLHRDLQPDLLGYAETLDLELPPVGSYQLIANVVLFDDTAAVVFGPVLNVVP